MVLVTGEEGNEEEDPTCNWETSMAFRLTSSCCFCSRFNTTSSCLRCASSSSFWTLDTLWNEKVVKNAEPVDQSQGILSLRKRRLIPGDCRGPQTGSGPSRRLTLFGLFVTLIPTLSQYVSTSAGSVQTGTIIPMSPKTVQPKCSIEQKN